MTTNQKVAGSSPAEHAPFYLQIAGVSLCRWVGMGDLTTYPTTYLSMSTGAHRGPAQPPRSAQHPIIESWVSGQAASSRRWPPGRLTYSGSAPGTPLSRRGRRTRCSSRRSTCPVGCAETAALRPDFFVRTHKDRTQPVRQGRLSP
jgi:hypothetical protein